MTPQQLARWQTEMATAGFDAAVTIGLRLPILWRAMLAGDAAAVAECQRMVSEKALAAQRGAMAAGFELQRQWLAALTGGNSRGALHVAQAALRPAHRAAGTNARRLGRAALRRGRGG